MVRIPKEAYKPRSSEWLTQDFRTQKGWLENLAENVNDHARELVPAVRELQALIHSNSNYYMLFTSMMEQIPRREPYNHDPAGRRTIRDVNELLHILNHIISTAPAWNDHSYRFGLVGVPLNALFAWTMSTSSGASLFLDPIVSAVLKKILDHWNRFLASPASKETLSKRPNGWFSPPALEALTAMANNATGSNCSFEELFICDANEECYGFCSWDDFFTRQFRFSEGIRPVAAPEQSGVIANPCESRPYNIAYNVRLRDRFWLKSQPYSVQDMLAQDDLSSAFVGGMIYQAFLDNLSYHRWHSPVDGKIVKAYLKQGTYFSVPPYQIFCNPGVPDIDVAWASQGYLTATASRAIIFIQAENQDVGLMCALFVGMVEVSTCEITVQQGQRVKKGEQLGMFRYGGSTLCLLFRKGVKVEGFPSPICSNIIPVRGYLAVVREGDAAQ